METGEHDDYLAIAHTKVPFGCQVLCQSQNDFFLHLGLRAAPELVEPKHKLGSVPSEYACDSVPCYCHYFYCHIHGKRLNILDHVDFSSM
jgi:hypothetical protein